MNQDFKEMLGALSEAEAEFMVIGAHAVAVYATPRATGDLAIGVAPARIDILTTIGGVDFAEAWPRRTEVVLWETTVPVIGRDDLIRSKRAAGRQKDLADLAELEREPE